MTAMKAERGCFSKRLCDISTGRSALLEAAKLGWARGPSTHDQVGTPKRKIEKLIETADPA